MLVDPEMKEIVDSFLLETKEILENLDVDLMELEKSPEDLDLLNKIFRSFHTVKGTSGFLGLEKLPEVTHKCEDILNKLRKGEAKLTTELMDGILLGFDTIKELLVKIENDKNEDVEVDNVINVLQSLLAGISSESSQDAPDTPVQNEDKSSAPADQPVEQKENNITAAGDNAPKEDVPKETDQPKKVAMPKSAPKTEPKKADNTIRVEVERLDALLNIASELVLGRNRLTQVNNQFALEYEGTGYAKDLADATKQIDLMTTELQLVVMKLRMIKIGKVFNRFPRLVRDLCKELNKEVELKIFGEDTEVDKNLIEEINDPLVHLIRNSVDHGVEKPEAREAAGKPRRGTVILSAEHEGNNIVITIEDDGKGIDPEVIKDRAIKKGFLSPERAKELSKQEAYNLIFHPGFSTAEQVSNVSGRGVGMDVVKTNVTKLRGTIAVESEVGKGTKIILRLPLTLAIISGMIVEACGQKLVIPLHSVIEVIRVNKEQIETVRGREVINLRDTVLPIVGLDELINHSGNGNGNEKQWQYIVEVGIAEKRFGIKVDDLVGQQEVVIKSLGNYLGKIDGIAGSTIMGDGTVVIILDINELFNKMEKRLDA
ncbi:Chemotaxis protein histidine kinase CheA [Melioribacter roseus P3M-2]|uniref:histidine kinase n=2 Tax=Melioribacteraceae TaxID=1334117 RepID=I7A2B2_MELRP|nr:Chemotaxis protein histidine kinase CheA [Melioribacter roseus P3M-2]